MKLNLEELILWVDEEILVVNKPSGLPTLPDGYDPDAPHLLSVLEPEVGPLWIVHRLDRPTSGVLVLARTALAHRALNTQFESRSITKLYHALVVGNPLWDENSVKLALRPDGDRKHRTRVDARYGKPSATHLKVLQRFGRFTLVEANPETGRTHQVRVHLAAIGLPLVADGLYGSGRGLTIDDIKTRPKGEDREADSNRRPLLDRVGLHAWSLSLIHPSTQDRRLFSAPYPKDLSAALRQLQKQP